MYRREEDTFEGAAHNYTTDFSPYATSEARLPHVFNSATPPQFSRSPSPFMPLFGLYFPPMMAPVPAPTDLASDSSPSSEGLKRTRTDWNREETSILLENWGSLYESLKSASAKQKKVKS
ncbi:hypothetical protein ACROYT_G014361 [Oculina patagonica]